MSSTYFRLDEHVIQCQHLRQYPHATVHSPQDTLHLSVKQYTPLNNQQPKPGDVTIIGGHANGFPKELYEPLWDEILKCAKAASLSIRSIWIADVAQQGASSVINEGKLGNDPCWFDHPRDLLHMINQFRDQIQHPIIGIGHSMGGNNLVNLALMHPILFQTLILIDPVISKQSSYQGEMKAAQASALRRDRWPSRSAAREAFKSNKFYQPWDSRVLDLWVKHGLRALPTALYPDAKQDAQVNAEGEVTLTTTKHQEVMTFLRIAPQQKPFDSSKRNQVLLTYPDFPGILSNSPVPFYRPEPIITFNNLPHLRPSVLYIFGDQSYLSSAEARFDKMTATGTGIGGSGGAAAGRVREVVLKGVGHMIPMEKVQETAEQSFAWMVAELERWKEQQDNQDQEWKSLRDEEKPLLSKMYLDLLLGFNHPSRQMKL